VRFGMELGLLNFLWKMMSGRHLKCHFQTKIDYIVWVAADQGRQRRAAFSQPAVTFSQRLVQLITFGKIPSETMSSRPPDCASIGID